MARPKRSGRQEFYDVFADFDVADQGIVLEFLTELHRQAKRQSSRKVPSGGSADAPAQTRIDGLDGRPA